MVKLTQAELNAIAQAVWAKAPTNMPTGGIGEWISKKLLTVSKYLGLK